MENEEQKPRSMSVREALDMFEAFKTYWADNYREATIDLKMAAGDKATHWGADVLAARNAMKKNTLVINELPQFIHQVTNDIRQNTPSIRVLPEQDGDIETANVFSDLIRGIEYKSCADEAYDTAAEYAVKCGIGFIGVDHDYIDDESDEQELKIKSVPDPLTVYNDPASVECDGRDSNAQIVLEPCNKKDFDRLYPGKKFTSFTDPKVESKESVILANIFIREFGGKRGKKITVRHYKFSGDELLAETQFPGSYVPYTPVYGEITWIEGKRIISSLIRQARDPQLRLNHWASKEAEILNMAPVAPVMAARGTLVNDRGQWQSPGTETVLEYELTDIDNNPAPKPERLQPPPIPTGIINAMQGAKENIKESMGLYNASIGQKSNETSGVAIDARKMEGDVATFHFPDNVRRSINQVGRILVDAVPVVVDTPRLVQTVTQENEPKMVAVNGFTPMPDDQQRPFDLSKGKYHVRVSTGASFTTKRQEAAQFLSDMFKQAPELMQIGGDILFKNLDLPGSEALAARFKKTIAPNLLDDQERAQDQQAIDPRIEQLSVALQQSQEQIQQLSAALEAKQGDLQIKQAELAIKAEELKLKEREVELKYSQAMQQQEAPVQQPSPQTAAPQPQAPIPIDLRLDTSGFQISKTPEQYAMEQEQEQLEAERQMQMQQAMLEKEQMEAEQRAQQTTALLGVLNNIAEQVNHLTTQISQPKQVVRDENGAILGVR